MTFLSARSAWMMTCALVSAGAGMPASEVRAQETTKATTVEELPEVIVEGAAGKSKKPKQATSTRLYDIDEEAAPAVSAQSTAASGGSPSTAQAGVAQSSGGSD